MMKAMGLAATAADGVFAARLAAQGFTGPSGTLEWLTSKMKPVKEGLAVDLELARYRLPEVAFKRFPIQVELQAVAEAGASLSSKVRDRIQDIWPGATLPVSSTRFIQPIAVLIATPNCLAARLRDIPPSIAATTRLRRSKE
ncbi:hypothetical protein ABIB80_006704 [Bradyrhizobium sp. i1.15.2]